MESVATEVAPFGIRTMIVEPGLHYDRRGRAVDPAWE